MADLLFFSQTSKSVDNFDVTKAADSKSAKQEVSHMYCDRYFPLQSKYYLKVGKVNKSLWVGIPFGQPV